MLENFQVQKIYKKIIIPNLSTFVIVRNKREMKKEKRNIDLSLYKVGGNKMPIQPTYGVMPSRHDISGV